MTPPEAVGWGVLGLLGGGLAGQLSLQLERLLKDDDPAPKLGPTALELALLPLLGFVGFAAFALRQGMGAGLLVHSLWILVLLQVMGFDLKHRLILDVVTLPWPASVPTCRCSSPCSASWSGAGSCCPSPSSARSSTGGRASAGATSSWGC